jgi:hypothetical protein
LYLPAFDAAAIRAVPQCSTTLNPAGGPADYAMSRASVHSHAAAAGISMGTLPYATMVAGLKTRPGEDAHLTDFTAVEAISEPFAYNTTP